MRTVLLSLAAVAAVLPAAVSAAPALHTFEVDGQSYSYSAERATDGTVLLVGDAGGSAFRLNVRKNHVEGQMGLSDVDFYVPRTTAAKLAAEVPEAAPTTLASK